MKTPEQIAEAIAASAWTVAVDFDGPIHEATLGYHDGTLYGRPTPGAFDALSTLHRRGYAVVIFTAREGLEAVERWIEEHRAASGVWFEFTVTNRKPGAIAYIDDKAVRFEWKDPATEWGRILTRPEFVDTVRGAKTV